MINDTARPRFLPLTPTRRLEVDYLLDAPTVPVALTVVDRNGREVSDDVVIALAWRMTRGQRRPRALLSALRVLCDVAVARQRERLAAESAARNLAQAEEHDASWVDEPIPFEVVDPPAPDDGTESALLWESCFGSDPEAPDVYRLTGDDVDEFAARESTTRRVLRALDRAAGGAR